MPITIGFIIPTYNRAPALERLLLQLALQTRQPDEVIVVDDHSSDDTKKRVAALQATQPYLRYIENDGHYQRDGKRTGLARAKSQYLGFLDDDALIEDIHFLQKLEPLLHPQKIIQAKIILENLGKKDEKELGWTDRFATHPYPLLELFPPNYNAGISPRVIYPLIEFGNVWPAALKNYFIDDDLIKDAYGESYVSSLRLYRAGYKLLLVPDLVIRHPGSVSGGSQRFQKKALWHGFTEFHEGYFYNMVSIHARYLPLWVWLWLPYFILKIIIGVLLNRNLKSAYYFGLLPLGRGLKKLAISSMT